MLFFLFRKSYIFLFFLFSKKFIISYEKVENKLISTKSLKNKHHLNVLLLVFQMKSLLFN